MGEARHELPPQPENHRGSPHRRVCSTWRASAGSADQLTDGYIPRRTLTVLAREAGIGTTMAAAKRAEELEEAGLWERNGGTGWQVHDFVEMNPGATRAGVEKERQRWKDRQGAGVERS